MRRFEIARGWEDKDINLPKRQTKFSAGYDICAAENITVPPYNADIDQKPTLVPTGLKVRMHDDEVVLIVNRSSNPIKRGLVLSNSIGVLDKDYYGNPDNDGHLYVQLINIRSKAYKIKKGDAIAQAIFVKYLITDDDVAGGKRMGGHGSTDKNTNAAP